MARDSAGVYSLPSGYLAQTGQTILASQHNPPLEDIAQALTGSLPRNGAAPMLADLSMASHKVTNLAAGTADTDAVNRGQLIAAGAPVGSLVDFAGNIIPVGWLLAYGQAVSRTTYSELFAIIGTTFGVGNGSTTFNLPDCRGRVSSGKDDMGGTSAGRLSGVVGALARAIGGAFGTPSHMLSPAEMPSHQHGGTTLGAGAHAHTFALGISGSLSAGAANLQGPQNGARAYATDPVGDHTHTIVTDIRGADQAHLNIQPTIIFNKIIKASNAG